MLTGGHCPSLPFSALHCPPDTRDRRDRRAGDERAGHGGAARRHAREDGSENGTDRGTAPAWRRRKSACLLAAAGVAALAGTSASPHARRRILLPAPVPVARSTRGAEAGCVAAVRVVPGRWAALLAVHDAVLTWKERRDRHSVRLGAPGPPRDLGLRFVAFFDEEPGGGPAGVRPELGAHAGGGGEPEDWVRYPVADAEQCRNQDVLSFVRNNGGNVGRVAFRQFALHGGGHRRGLAAAARILEDEEAVSVPLGVSMSIHSALLSPGLGEELARLIRNGTLDEFSALAAYMLHEAGNASSFYRPFLCSLPRRIPLPIFQDVAQLTQGPWGNDTKYLRAVAAIGRVLRDTYASTSAALLQRRPDLFPAHVGDLGAWLWCVALQPLCCSTFLPCPFPLCYFSTRPEPAPKRKSTDVLDAPTRAQPDELDARTRTQSAWGAHAVDRLTGWPCSRAASIILSRSWGVAVPPGSPVPVLVLGPASCMSLSLRASVIGLFIRLHASTQRSRTCIYPALTHAHTCMRAPTYIQVLELGGGATNVSNITRMHVLAPVADMVRVLVGCVLGACVQSHAGLSVPTKGGREEAREEGLSRRAREGNAVEVVPDQ